MTAVVVKRHRTAISRGQLSVPLQTAARHGFLDGSKSIFDYGCGRGNDVAILKVAGQSRQEDQDDPPTTGRLSAPGKREPRYR